MNHFKYKDFSSGAELSWEPLGKTETNPSQGRSEEELHQLRKMVTDLTQAVLDYGPNKAQHLKVLVRHRTEWPHLWDQIDTMISYVAESASKAE